ncbi:MAG TPA: helix-turn-helix domain-containing protein, partial [Cyclobacteriaceae bacterium]
VILNQFVCFIKRNRVKPKNPLDAVGSLILKHQGKVSLDWLAKEACLSVKQFERNFEDQIGITPKLFARVTRFDKAYRMKQLYPEMDWLSVAVNCGYHDYQHLVRDYKDFTSHTPTGFYKVEEHSPERTWGLSEYYRDCIQ